MNAYRLSAAALVDLDQISRTIAAENPTAAADWLEEVFAACERAAGFPEIGRRREELARGLRSIPVGNYVVF